MSFSLSGDISLNICFMYYNTIYLLHSVSCGVFNRVVQGPLRNSTVYEGGVAELWCQFHAVYNASIEWSRHKDELNSQAIVTTRKSPFNGTLFLVSYGGMRGYENVFTSFYLIWLLNIAFTEIEK